MPSSVSVNIDFIRRMGFSISKRAFSLHFVPHLMLDAQFPIDFIRYIVDDLLSDSQMVPLLLDVYFLLENLRNKLANGKQIEIERAVVLLLILQSQKILSIPISTSVNT